MSTAGMMPAMETAARSVAANFTDAWNRHDAKALAALFTEDGDLINPAGREANGRAEIEALFTEEHATHFRISQMRQTVSRVRALAADVVVSTNRCEVSDMQLPGGPDTRTVNAFVTVVLKNESGAWRIAVARPMVPVTPPQ